MRRFVFILVLGMGLFNLQGCNESAFKNGFGQIALIQSQGVIADHEFLVEVAREFYKSYPDEFDMLVLWGAPEFAPGHSFYLPVKNDVPGIGYGHLGPEFFDEGAEFGSSGRLQGIIWMGPDWIANDDEGLGPRSVLGILAQETGHRWCCLVNFKDPDLQTDSSALLTQDGLHWNFYLNTAGSPMGGNRWEPLGDDLFQGEVVDLARYFSLDLYLMGLLPAEAVDPAELLMNVQWVGSSTGMGLGGFIRVLTEPMQVKADLKEISIDEIIEAEGLRDPDVGFNAKNIRQAWIYVYRGSILSSFTELNRLKEFQEQWDDFFNQATEGLSSMNTALF